MGNWGANPMGDDAGLPAPAFPEILVHSAAGSPWCQFLPSVTRPIDGHTRQTGIALRPIRSGAQKADGRSKHADRWCLAWAGYHGCGRPALLQGLPARREPRAFRHGRRDAPGGHDVDEGSLTLERQAWKGGSHRNQIVGCAALPLDARLLP